MNIQTFAYSVFVYGIFPYFLAIVQALVSMSEYAENVSSSCFGCSFFNETARYSVIVFLLIPAAIIARKTKFSHALLCAVLSFFFGALMLTISVDLFEARVASWTTYTYSELYFFVASKCVIVILICVLLFFFLCKRNR